MKKRGLSLLLFMVILLVLISPVVYAAKLYGTIYDYELNPLNKVVVSVDMTPVQRYVSNEGEYEFILAPGNYTLTAGYVSTGDIKFTVEEHITILEEGEYVYDLFLFPDFSDEEDLLNDPINASDTDPEPPLQPKISPFWYFLVLILLLLIIYWIYVKFGKSKSKKEKEIKILEPGEEEDDGIDEDLQNVIDIIKKQDGRTTQKELRKEIPLSEAKISLMVSELEHRGVLKKIKKGRGNIIVLVKKK